MTYKATIAALKKRTLGMSVPGPQLSEDERRAAADAYAAMIEGQRNGAEIVSPFEMSGIPEHLRIIEGMSPRDAADRYRQLLDWFPNR